ncbi:MAG: HlyD family type I secretion periplasmic adaptor subunit [Beijerinckiaceae bacterium]
MSEPVSRHVTALRKSFLLGVGAVALFGGTLGLWAATSPLAGAVVASGQFVVDSNVKKVQHQQGGIVADLKVRDGDRVKAGDMLVRLDETITRANQQIVVKQLDELYARKARLEAERDGRPEVETPADLAERLALPEVQKALQDERRLFETRGSQRAGQKGQLAQRIDQLREEISGIDAQIASRDQQLGFLKTELNGVRDLFKRNLVPITRVMPLERETSNITGQRGQLVASRAQTEGKISEIRLQLLQIDIELQTEAVKELRDIQAKTAELNERRIAAEDQLRRMDIRAPIDGVVHQLNVHTVGGVITPAEPVMLVVPEGGLLEVEARVSPTDVDQLHAGQPATVKVMAGNQRTTPELSGAVSRVSADVTKDQQTGVTYYTVRITLPDSEKKKLGDLTIMPGMLAESYIRTAERTPFQYLMKPLTDQFQRAFRER